jgi:hypothetical protein
MRTPALALAALLAFGATACHHGSSQRESSHHQSAALPAPSPYTPRTVQRAFARAGVRLRHDRQMETFARTSSEPSGIAAFFRDGTGDVQVFVVRPTGTRQLLVALHDADGPVGQPVTKTLGNVSVTYEKYGADAPRAIRAEAPRVLRALALLRQSRAGLSRLAELSSGRRTPALGVDPREVQTRQPSDDIPARWPRRTPNRPASRSRD